MTTKITFDSKENQTIITKETSLFLITIYWMHDTNSFAVFCFNYYDQSNTSFNRETFEEVKEYLDSVYQLDIDFNIE